MGKFTIKLNNTRLQEKELNTSSDKQKIVIEESINRSPEERTSKISSPKKVGRAKGSTKALYLKKVAIVRGYCTKQDKLLFTAYCKSKDISESAYIESCVKKAVKTLKK